MDKQPQNKSKIMILGGATGLLGQALTQAAEAAGHEVMTLGRKDFDLTDSKQLAAAIDGWQPDVVCNTIAYTQVDKAEEEEDEAVLINRTFPCMLGRIVRERPSIYLMHFSTDFVFDGKKTGAYTEEDSVAPLNVYGRSKLEGELALVELGLPAYSVVRTAWLFGPGKKNFVSTILGVCREKQKVSVVHDQIGSPTYTIDLAAYCMALIAAKGQGIFHLVNSGEASWCELAAEAARLAQQECAVTPIPTKDYPQKAKRPAFSVLSTFRFSELTGIKPRSWTQALADYIYSADV